jgi:hypothetical protein
MVNLLSFSSYLSISKPGKGLGYKHQPPCRIQSAIRNIFYTTFFPEITG